MIDVGLLLFGLLVGWIVGLLVGARLGADEERRIREEEQKPSAGESLADLYLAALKEHPKGELSKPNGGFETDFSVTGKPRRVPWRFRKLERTEAAKTKRKKLESFQEYV